MLTRTAALTFCAVLGMFAAAAAQDESHGVREFTASGTWTVPAGVTRITVELWGGGGGGAGGASAVLGGGPGGGGGAGGGGAYVRTSLGVKPGETHAIEIGAGGPGGRGESRNAAEPGENGGDTIIRRDSTILLVAKGGRGGGAPKRGHPKGGIGGAGGAAESTPTVLVRPGNNGSAGHEGGFAEWESTSGGKGGAAILGTLQPPGAFGGAGGAGRHFGYSDNGYAGGAGSVVITW